MTQPGEFLSLLPGWDASPSQGYLPPSIKFAMCTLLYTLVERGTVRVKCLAQEHNAISPARVQSQTALGMQRRAHQPLGHCTSLICTS